MTGDVTICSSSISSSSSTVLGKLHLESNALPLRLHFFVTFDISIYSTDGDCLVVAVGSIGAENAAEPAFYGYNWKELNKSHVFYATFRHCMSVDMNLVEHFSKVSSESSRTFFGIYCQPSVMLNYQLDCPMLNSFQKFLHGPIVLKTLLLYLD